MHYRWPRWILTRHSKWPTISWIIFPLKKMKLKLLYFGRPRDNLNISSETADVPDSITTLAQLLAWLRERGGKWEQELADNRVRCAINQEMADLSGRIANNDEVAIFSPISGG